MRIAEQLRAIKLRVTSIPPTHAHKDDKVDRRPQASRSGVTTGRHCIHELELSRRSQGEDRGDFPCPSQRKRKRIARLFRGRRLNFTHYPALVAGVVHLGDCISARRISFRDCSRMTAASFSETSWISVWVTWRLDLCAHERKAWNALWLSWHTKRRRPRCRQDNHGRPLHQRDETPGGEAMATFHHRQRLYRALMAGP
jgi:hypothetical protein